MLHDSRHRPPVRSRRLLLGAGAAAGLAGAVALAVSLAVGAAPACAAPPVVPLAVPAAPPVAGSTYSGQATHYQLPPGGSGNCAFPSPPADGHYAALSPTEYVTAAACGAYLDVTGPNGTVRVVVVDLCPECAAGHLDLSRDAFARLADLSAGIVPVTYQLVVDPPEPGPLAFRVKDGASQWWFAVQVIDHGNPLATVEARAPGGGFQALVRHDYNYWLAEDGLGPGPYTLRVTDVYGQQATVPDIQLAPEQLQPTDVRLYGTPATAPAPVPPTTTPPTATASPQTAATGDPRTPDPKIIGRCG